jgi:hypothetical protein
MISQKEPYGDSSMNSMINVLYLFHYNSGYLIDLIVIGAIDRFLFAGYHFTVKTMLEKIRY